MNKEIIEYPTTKRLYEIIENEYTGINKQGLCSLSTWDHFSNVCQTSHYYGKYAIEYLEELRANGYYKFYKPSDSYSQYHNGEIDDNYSIYYKDSIPHIANFTKDNPVRVPIRSEEEFHSYLEKEGIKRKR